MEEIDFLINLLNNKQRGDGKLIIDVKNKEIDNPEDDGGYNGDNLVLPMLRATVKSKVTVMSEKSKFTYTTGLKKTAPYGFFQQRKILPNLKMTKM
jgi:hypothetical protein